MIRITGVSQCSSYKRSESNNLLLPARVIPVFLILSLFDVRLFGLSQPYRRRVNGKNLLVLSRQAHLQVGVVPMIRTPNKSPWGEALSLEPEEEGLGFFCQGISRLIILSIGFC